MFGAGLPRSKYYGDGQFNPKQDRTTCHMSWGQAYEFSCIFRTSLCDFKVNASGTGTKSVSSQFARGKSSIARKPEVHPKLFKW